MNPVVIVSFLMGVAVIVIGLTLYNIFSVLG